LALLTRFFHWDKYIPRSKIVEANRANETVRPSPSASSSWALTKLDKTSFPVLALLG